MYVAYIDDNAEVATAFADPIRALWTTTNRAAICSLPNVAPIRVKSGALGGVRLPSEKGEQDIATALAMARSGRFKHVIIDSRFEKSHAASVFLQRLTTNRTSALPFEQQIDELELLEMHKQRLRLPDERVRVVSIFSGIGSDFGTLVSCGVDPRDIVCVDVCPENAETIRTRFPGATVIPRDVRAPGLEKELRGKSGKYDLALVYILCQASSGANRHRKTDDYRIGVGELGVDIACKLTTGRPNAMIITEDVVGSNRTRRSRTSGSSSV